MSASTTRLGIQGATTSMAVGYHHSFVCPQTDKSERGGAQAHSIVCPKTGEKERGAGIYPDLPGRWDKHRITWSLAKVKQKKPNFPNF